MFNFSAQRRMRWATAFRAGDKVPPCLLRYATAAMLSEKTATTRPSKEAQRALRPLSMANSSRWLIEREASPSSQTPETKRSATVAPQTWLEASDQNIWSGELGAREIPSSRPPSVHHHRSRPEKEDPREPGPPRPENPSLDLEPIAKLSFEADHSERD